MYELYFSDEDGNKITDETSASYTEALTGKGKYVCVKFLQSCLVISEDAEDKWKTSFDYSHAHSGIDYVGFTRHYMAPGSTWLVETVSHNTNSSGLYFTASLEFVRILDDGSQSS